MNRTKNMTSGSPARLILSFAVPLIFANLGQQVYMIVDAIIVGKGVGVEALAAVGATDWSYWLVLWIIQALTQGFSIPIAQAFGEKNVLRMKKTIAKSIQLCLGMSIFLTVVSLAAGRPLLRLLQTPDNIMTGATNYLLTMYGGILIVMAFNMASSILRAFGDGKTPLIAITIAAVTNILLDLLFVCVFHWGIVGAAAATLTAQFLAFLYCFRVLRKMEALHLEKEHWERDPALTGVLCRLGLPLTLQQILIAVGGMVLQSAINQHGFVFIAGFTATNKIYGLLESSAVSLGYAATTYVAQNYGAGLYSRIRAGVKSAAAISLLLSVGVSVLMITGGHFILNLFIDRSSAEFDSVSQISRHYLFIMSCFLSILYMLHTFQNILRGLGNAITPFLSGVMEFIARVTASLVLVRVWGQEVLFFAEPCAWTMATLVLASMCIRQVRALPKEDAKSAPEPLPSPAEHT